MSEIDGRYRLHREIAQGSQVSLHAGEHLHTGRLVSVKLAMGREGGVGGQLLREARALGKARHCAVVEILDAGDGELGPFLVTELLDGRTLDATLTLRSTLPVGEALDMAVTVGEGLAAAHRVAVLHEGLTPSSIWLPSEASRQRDQLCGLPAPPAKVLDFGIAPNPSSVGGGRLAASAYAPPERLSSGEPDLSDDAYALLAILFECLSGELPGALTKDERRAHLGPVPRAVSEVLERGLDARERRFASIMELLEALAAARRVTPSHKALAPAQRRAARRAAYITPARLVRRGGPVDGHTEDVSVGGILVLVSEPLERGEAVQVRFALPSSSRTVTLQAEVRWVGGGEGRAHAVGLAFQTPPDDAVDDIRAYVAFFATSEPASASDPGPRG